MSLRRAPVTSASWEFREGEQDELRKVPSTLSLYGGFREGGQDEPESSRPQTCGLAIADSFLGGSSLLWL